jgi:hypothetical protein
MSTPATIRPPTGPRWAESAPDRGLAQHVIPERRLSGQVAACGIAEREVPKERMHPRGHGRSPPSRARSRPSRGRRRRDDNPSGTPAMMRSAGTALTGSG